MDNKKSQNCLIVGQTPVKKSHISYKLAGPRLKDHKIVRSLIVRNPYKLTKNPKNCLQNFRPEQKWAFQMSSPAIPNSLTYNYTFSDT